MMFREAVADDLEAILALLADDPLGATREGAADEVYRSTFDALQADPNHILAVADDGGIVVGTLQITFIAGLSRRAALRGQIESVRIACTHRGRGLGKRFFGWVIERCRERGCTLVQLTSDRSRTEAQRFYEGLGFNASHVGYKLDL